MNIRLIMARKIAIDLIPEVRDAIEQSENAHAESCLIDMCPLTLKEAKDLLSNLEILCKDPTKIADASFISQRFIKRSGNPQWKQLHDLIEECK
ncbi:MAG: hypothetical protein IKN65_08815 [Clostridia bacterium]|nr:hypothetical protein [Clostridia bacterium]